MGKQGVLIFIGKRGRETGTVLFFGLFFYIFFGLPRLAGNFLTPYFLSIQL